METGRPTKLDQNKIKEICELLSAGNYIEPSCAYAGINKVSFYNWLKRGRREKEEGKKTQYVEFLNAVEKALAEGELRHVNNIAKHAKTSWQASAWMLERKNHKQWGRKETIKNEDVDTPKEKSDMTSGESLNAVLADLVEEAEKDRWDE